MSALYTNGLQAIMAGEVDLINNEVSVALIGPGYVPDLANEVYQSEIQAHILAEKEVAGNTLDGTTFRADSVTFQGVAAGVQVSALVIIKNTGDGATSLLLCHIDATTGASPISLPFTTTGEDITINWDPGAAGIFKL